MGAALTATVLKEDPELAEAYEKGLLTLPTNMIDEINRLFSKGNIAQTAAKFQQDFGNDGQEYRFSQLMVTLLDLNKADRKLWRTKSRKVIKPWARRAIEQIVTFSLSAPNPIPIHVNASNGPAFDMKWDVSGTSRAITIDIQGPLL